jgi:hypothetical protein
MPWCKSSPGHSALSQPATRNPQPATPIRAWHRWLMASWARRMIFLFRNGTFRQKCWLIFKATRQHARNLGVFALIYKSSLLVLQHTSSDGKVAPYHPFIGGLLGGYYVFGRHQNSVNQQIVVYIFARVMLALAKLAIKPREAGVGGDSRGGLGLASDPQTREFVMKHAWTAFASLSWASVMFLFRYHPEIIQPSLRSSMTYM